MDSADYRHERAVHLHDSGQTRMAVEVLTELLAENPDDAFCHGLLASCLLDQKRLIAAEYECGIALRLDPSMPYLHRVHARVLFLSNKPDEAIAACDESLRLDPDSAGAHLLKSSFYSFKGDREATRQCIDQAAALAPGDIDVTIAYGDYFNETGDHGRAYEYATEALRQDASNISANILMGETQLALGNSEEAAYHAKFAITNNPESESALSLFANIKMRKSPVIGLWWRFNTWISTLGTMKSALVLIGGYIGFNLLSQVAADLDYPTTSSFLAYAWLLIVAYSWFGIPMYHRALARELDDFSFNPRF